MSFFWHLILLPARKQCLTSTSNCPSPNQTQSPLATYQYHLYQQRVFSALDFAASLGTRAYLASYLVLTPRYHVWTSTIREMGVPTWDQSQPQSFNWNG
eukprot:323858-Rhodomonas_salina.3